MFTLLWSTATAISLSLLWNNIITVSNDTGMNLVGGLLVLAVGGFGILGWNAWRLGK